MGSIRNCVTWNTDMDKNREMKKKSYIQTIEASSGMGLKYFALYAVSVKGALPLPSCIELRRFFVWHLSQKSYYMVKIIENYL